MPKTWRTHDSFHVSLVEPYRAGNRVAPDSDQVLRETASAESEDNEVEKVLGSLIFEGKVKYRAKWKSWEGAKNLTWEQWEQSFTDEAKAEVIAL